VLAEALYQDPNVWDWSVGLRNSKYHFLRVEINQEKVRGFYKGRC
jgi:hypothetical protein